jgi:diguanylate cyclase (GGDEF)-like protein
MNISFEFLTSMVDTLTEHIAVIDRHGKILFVNKSWCLFSKENDHTHPDKWIGKNYLAVCSTSATEEEGPGYQAAQGILGVISGKRNSYYLEYPCDSPTTKRWFMMRAVPFQLKGETYVVISHSNITERKLAEEQVVYLSRTDSLTGLANRRFFDEWYEKTWARCTRNNTNLTLALIDIDNFKQLNDSFGHHEGDICLQKISSELLSIARRPDDICVRYGGDEFMIVFGNTPIENALSLLDKFKLKVTELNIPYSRTVNSAAVSLSIGAVTIQPDNSCDQTSIIRHADNLLYAAKENGKDSIKYKNLNNL